MVEQRVAEQTDKPQQPQAYAWRMSRQERRLRLLCVLPGLVLGLMVFQPSLSMGGDNAEYLVLARSLATHQGYSVISDPVVRPETRRPPGTPAFYALAMMVLGERLWLLKGLTLLTLLLGGWLAWPVLRMQAGSTILATVAGVGTFMWTLQNLACGVITGSEMPYTALTLLALLGIARYMGPRDIVTIRPRHAGWSPATEDHRYAWLAVAIVSSVAAIYVRPNGVTLIPALGIYLLLHRQWRAVAFSIIAGGILLAPLAVMQHRAASEGATYAAYANTVETSQGERKLTGAGDLLRRTAKMAAAQTLNLGGVIGARPESLSLRPRPILYAPGELVQTATAAAEPTSRPVPSPLTPFTFGHMARYLMGLLALWGLIITWRGRGGVMHWYMVMNILMLVLTPFARGRYLLPLLPMWGWFLAMSLMWFAHRVSRVDGAKLGSLAVTMVLVAIASFTFFAGVQQVLVNIENRGLPYYAPTRYAMDGTDIMNYAAAAGWIASNAPPNAVVICRKPSNVYWITGRRCTWGPMWQQDPEQLWRDTLALARYGPVFIIQDAFINRFHGDLSERNLKPALLAHRDQIEPVLTLSAPRTIIWRLKQPAPAAQTARVMP